MVLVDFGALTRGPVATACDISPGDPLLNDLGVVLRDPVQVRGRLTESGPGRYYWQATLHTSMAATCRRCLTAVSVPVAASVAVLFAEDIGDEDASVYAIPPRAQELDLSEAIREELILAVPEYVDCSEECQGICPGCGTDLNTGACSCQPERDTRWAALDALKAAGPNDVRQKKHGGSQATNIQESEA